MRVALGVALFVLAAPGPASAQVPFEATACGASTFARADVTAIAFERFAIGMPPLLLSTSYVEALVAQVQAGAARAQHIAAGFEPVLACRSPTWSVAALVRQGRTYEVLAHAIATSASGIADPALRARIETAMTSRMAALGSVRPGS
jgi:hypothetical protein